MAEDDVLLKQLQKRPRPRSLFVGTDESNWRSTVLSRRKNIAELLRGSVRKGTTRPPLTEAPKLVERKAGSEDQWAASSF